jgi:hypothetical protein
MVFINYLVSQRSPLVQLDDDLAVLLSISTCIKLYKQLNLDGLDEYKVSNLVILPPMCLHASKKRLVRTKGHQISQRHYASNTTIKNECIGASQRIEGFSAFP